MANEFEQHKHHEVRIHINREPYQSANPTTGEGLRVLATVPNGQDLYREARGDHEDEPIERDEEVFLTEDEHFYSAEPSKKPIVIVINGTETIFEHKTISFETLAKLAFPEQASGNTYTYTAKYWNGPRVNPQGSIVAGQSVKVKNRMVFDVTRTIRS